MDKSLSRKFLIRYVKEEKSLVVEILAPVKKDKWTWVSVVRTTFEGKMKDRPIQGVDAIQALEGAIKIANVLPFAIAKQSGGEIYHNGEKWEEWP